MSSFYVLIVKDAAILQTVELLTTTGREVRMVVVHNCSYSGRL